MNSIVKCVFVYVRNVCKRCFAYAQYDKSPRSVIPNYCHPERSEGPFDFLGVTNDKNETYIISKRIIKQTAA